MTKEPQIELMELEYITSQCSYADLARKWKLPRKRVETLGKLHDWYNKRLQFRGVLEAPMKTRTQELEILMDSALRLAKTFHGVASDESQFYLPAKDENAKPTRADIKSMKEAVTTLKTLVEIIRDLAELPNQGQKHTQTLEKAKYALNKNKGELPDTEIILAREVAELAR